MYSIDLKVFRTANKMTQKELAIYLGVGQGFVSQIEKGDRPMPEKYISKILADDCVDSSMVVSSSEPHPATSVDPERINRLIDTVCSQQETIARQCEMLERFVVKEQGGDARQDGGAKCAVAE